MPSLDGQPDDAVLRMIGELRREVRRLTLRVPAADLEWTAPTLINSWANFGSGHTPAGFLIDGEGFVHLRGLITGGASASVAFVLPAGFRPAYIAHLSTWGPTTVQAPAVARILTDGSVEISYNAGGALVTLESLIFDTRA